MLGDPTELMKLNCTEVDYNSTNLGDELVSGLCISYQGGEGLSHFINNVTSFLDGDLFNVLDAFNAENLTKLTIQNTVDNALGTVKDQLNIVYNSYNDIFYYLYRVILGHPEENKSLGYFESESWKDVVDTGNAIWDMDRIETIGSLGYVTEIAEKFSNKLVNDNSGYVTTYKNGYKRKDSQICITYNCIENTLKQVLSFNMEVINGKSDNTRRGLRRLLSSNESSGLRSLIGYIRNKGIGSLIDEVKNKVNRSVVSTINEIEGLVVRGRDKVESIMGRGRNRIGALTGRTKEGEDEGNNDDNNNNDNNNSDGGLEGIDLNGMMDSMNQFLTVFKYLFLISGAIPYILYIMLIFL